MYSLLQVVVQKIESTFTESHSKKHLKRSRQMLIRSLNTIGSQQEISATRATSYLMKFPDHITNVQFSTIPWYSLAMWFLEQEKSDDSNSIDGDASETFTIEKDENTFTYVIHNFRINYQNRPDTLSNISTYEFASRFYKVPNLRYHRLLRDHSQYETHSLHEYKVPRIPIIQGYRIPSFKNDCESYSRTMSILFYPWRTFLDVKKCNDKSWSENFEQLYPLLSTFDKKIIKNINISHECKESRDADRLMRASENDNNEQTNCDKHEHSTMDGLYDENIGDEEDHIFDEPIEIHDNTNIEQTFTTSSLLQLEAEYFTANSMKTNYVIDACDLLNSMHTSKDITNEYEKETNPFGFLNSSQSKNLLKELKALNKK
jgi:hypothetical protein